ncbi:MAG TPA: hypothetical protein VFI42_13675 [Thermomicrobiaceae bacterium]|nr:hypothetical protein [Thermomicrobiaceae bacterium]
MRVLLMAQPGAGHWRPLAPLARALEQEGAEFQALPSLASAVELIEQLR